MISVCRLKSVFFVTVLGLSWAFVFINKVYIVPVNQPPRPMRTINASGSNYLNPTQKPDQACVEKKRVAFIKVHKAASTTVTTIIQRYGLRHNLNFAFPVRDFYHINLFGTFHPLRVHPLRKGAVYEVVCQHVVYNREAFRQYLPANMTLLAIVRQPFQMFVSAFQYFHEYRTSVARKLHRNATREFIRKHLQRRDRSKLQPVESVKAMSSFKQQHRLWLRRSIPRLMSEYLRDPEFYEPLKFKRGSLVFNRMSFDLGIPKEQYLNVTFVNDYIQQLDQDMTLVLVHEYFDQSLVLLKRRLCWSMKDILYRVQHKGPPKPQLPEDLKTLHRQKAPSEYQIYNFFENKLLTLIANESAFAEEVKVFKDTQDIVMEFCRQPSSTLQVPRNQFDEGFQFNRHDCRLLAMGEVSLEKYLTALHKRRGILAL